MGGQLGEALTELFVLAGILLTVGTVVGIAGSVTALYLRRARRRARHRRRK
ncbi:hypothetical protein [Thermomonospora cellulosilytica]|uniref:Uncharacterized protein n=1 Tax=Thermomonospora cellulosilytica TaxID=1411118 RepID=A0A7W3R7X0_9ACTN|nr:hypothetical protein [Thermomonospora cellulosilytica]MBA9003076.1 hypothetical protein [Thermomonospora cellulosilytica]